MNMAMQISLQDPVLFSFLLDILPEVGLLDHMVILFLVFWGTSVLFSIVAVRTYIPTNSVGEPLLLVTFFSQKSYCSKQSTFAFHICNICVFFWKSTSLSFSNRFICVLYILEILTHSLSYILEIHIHVYWKYIFPLPYSYYPFVFSAFACHRAWH